MQYKTKTYEVGDQEMSFDHFNFQRLAKAFCKDHAITQTNMLDSIASATGVSASTVNNWFRGKNAPLDVETVELLAKFFGFNDMKFLLNEVHRRTNMDRANQRQIEAVKRITDKCIWYLSNYVYSDGYDKYYQEYKASGVEDLSVKIYDLAESFFNELMTVYEQEYFDLHDTDIYMELKSFIVIHQYYYSGSAEDQIPELRQYNPIRGEDIDLELFLNYMNSLRELQKIIKKYIG